jgi:hypothetical protein
MEQEKQVEANWQLSIIHFLNQLNILPQKDNDNENMIEAVRNNQSIKKGHSGLATVSFMKIFGHNLDTLFRLVKMLIAVSLWYESAP